jgi:hypothetical protein
MDVQTVALHELGHWVGLADLYSAGDAAKVMYGYVSTGFTKRALTADDIAGIQSIYGASAPPSAPTVTNSTGASNISYTSARLNGELTSNGNASTTVHIYWGDHDGGTTPPGQPGGWDNDVNLGTTSVGTFYADIPSLTPNTDYYYRCHATNSAGYDWADATYHFKTPASVNFTIVALPDTQHYSAFYPQTFTTQTQWIKDNETSKNIVFVTQEGDIIDTNSNTTQWANANTAMSLLDGQVPYGIAPGNHDGAPGETANFNTYFPYTRYSGQSWYGGHYGADNDNSYQLFSAGGQHFIILHIEYGADSNVLSWADSILKAYPTHRAIVTSHYLLNADGSFGTYGSNIYNALKGDSNLFLMLCGHMHGEASRMDIYNGNTVYTLLADYQERSNGGDGWLRAMEFSPTTNSISVKTYSPTLNQYEMDADSQFEVSYTSQKLIGHDDASFSGYGASNYISVTKFTASATGTVTELRIKCSGNGHVKVAMYADSGGNPGSLINSVGSTSVVSGWNTISLPSSTSITKDTAYWLAYISDTNNICGWVTGSEPKRYKTWAFSNAFPDPAGSGYSSGTSGDLVAGWGTITPPTPPIAPTVTNSTGASNVSSTSARLNGEITATGGENPMVIIYWGDDDGGTDPYIWDHSVNLGTKGAGAFYIDVSNLTPNTPYYYRCYASNSAGSDWADSTSQFKTPVQTQKLIGHDDAPFSGYGASNYISMTKYIASTTGTITELRIKCNGSGNVKVAIYSDSGGNPNSLLYSVGSTAVVGGVWNTILLPSSISVTKDTAYWLAYISNTNNICGWVTGSEPKQYKVWAFSSNFPDPAGSGYSSTTNGDLVAGWGTIVPPTAPTVTNASGATLVTSTSARLNGEVTSTGNENPSVTIYWGTTDGEETAGNWANHVDLGTKGLDTFYADIPSLTPNTTYYYRCFAQNSAGPNWAATSAQFTTLVQTQKLVGSDDTSFSGGLFNYISITKYTASTTGTTTEFRIKCNGSGHVKVALYADSGGEPGARLGVVNTPTAVVAGWNTISFPSTPVTKDTAYWLAYISDTDNIAGWKTSSDPKRFKVYSFSNGLPDPAGSGYSSSTNGDLVAGWGTITPPTPPPPPDLISPGATITFKWGAADRATKYQLQVSTSSSFATTVFDADVGNNTSQEVSGLSLGITYYWHVRAGNDGGWSNWSTTRSVTVNQVP